jgi:hypothetical protein
LVPTQVPPWHSSVCVQALLSLQSVPSGLFPFVQPPVAGLQTPAVLHAVAAPHDTGLLPVHTPFWQVSVCVQAFWSLHDPPVSGAWAQPVVGLQLSAVQGLLSSHEMAARWQAPPEHVPSETWHMSVAVQALPSSFWQAPEEPQALHAPQLALLQQNPSVQNRPAVH